MARVARTLVGVLTALTLLAAMPAPPAAAAPPATCSADFSSAALNSCIEAAAATYAAAWAPVLAAHGAAATAPGIVVFRAVPVNPCVDGSQGDVAYASFWCDRNATVYVSRIAAPWWTREYARQAREMGVLAADAAATHRSQRRLLRGFALQGAATELAHELGHWAQQQAGVLAWYQERMDTSGDRLAGRYQSAAELAADCMAGWVQGRAAASGTWRDSALIRWAQHATIAELGADMSGMRPGFRFPRDVPLIAHGGPYSRLRLYDRGQALGGRNADGLTACARAAAKYTGTPPPP
jgi:predicted metalloprotease